MASARRGRRRVRGRLRGFHGLAPRAPEGLHRRVRDGPRRLRFGGETVAAFRLHRQPQRQAVAALVVVPRERRAEHPAVLGAARGVHVGAAAVQVRPRVVLPGHRTQRARPPHRAVDGHAAVLRVARLQAHVLPLAGVSRRAEHGKRGEQFGSERRVRGGAAAARVRPRGHHGAGEGAGAWERRARSAGVVFPGHAGDAQLPRVGVRVALQVRHVRTALAGREASRVPGLLADARQPVGSGEARREVLSASVRARRHVHGRDEWNDAVSLGRRGGDRRGGVRRPRSRPRHVQHEQHAPLVFQAVARVRPGVVQRRGLLRRGGGEGAVREHHQRAVPFRR